MEKHNIKFKEILDFLNTYAGHSYNKPENIEDEMYKQQIINIRGQAQQSIKQFKEIGEYFKSNGYTFDANTASLWLDGSKTKIRSYFWIELKKTSKVNYTTSISIFAEKTNGQVRFKIALEIKDSNSKEKDYERHNKFLDMIKPEKLQFEYFGSRKNGFELEASDVEQIKNAIQQTKSGEIRKLQIGKTISYEQINNNTCDEILRIIENEVKKLEPYYDKAVGGVDNKMIFLDMGLEDFRRIIKTDSECIEKIKAFRKRKERITDWIVCCIFGTVKVSKNPYPHLISTNEKSIETSVRQNVSLYFQSIDYKVESEDENPKKVRKITDEMNEFMEKVFECDKLCNAIEMLKGEVKKSNKLVDEIDEFFKVLIEKLEEQNMENNEVDIHCKGIDGKNLILYGPPGTGKTYNTVLYAVAICDGKKLSDLETLPYKEVFYRYKELKDNDKRIAFTTFHQSYGYEEFIEGIKPVIDKQSDSDSTDVKYEYADGVFKKFCKRVEKIKENKGPYVFIIDEINRGNISKIFGELITLIEETKRKGEPECTTAILPYTGDEFGVPNNVYILGTMNTADRSIALMDTALRRRFKFVEMMPQSNVLAQLNITDIEGIDIIKMLDTINERIEYLYDREHTIGHAYFIPLAKEPTIEKLASIFKNAIIPLLQEYFYEDYSKIQLVLGDNAKEDDEYKFILDTETEITKIFKGTPDIDLPEKKYSIQTASFFKAESYKEIYE